ncbi:Serine/threonine protein kinase [Giardia duodenalis]|uniref:Serine/threonine protein kinase n=2 Tax=Giardia intestinalis TaxID=5741 RepID=V6TWI8_GIAIN|nr:Serine/threonine protein kinase [Giardia intestinalis]
MADNPVFARFLGHAPKITVIKKMSGRPIIALTLDIEKTYRGIHGLTSKMRTGVNQPQLASVRPQTDDRGYLIVRINDCFNGRYCAERPLGQGSFGRVVLAKDTMNNTYVAIKIMKAGKLFTHKGREEAEIMTMLSDEDPPISCKFIESFMQGNHYCIVMEALGSNLYHLLKSTKMQGFPLQTIRVWARRYLTSFKVLQHDRIRIIHTDCKPENTLIPFNNTCVEDIRIVDFGSAVRYPEGQMFLYIQSRYYRAPEVLLLQPYDYQIDIWSIAAILFEMHTGKVLFPAKSSELLCYMMIDILGYPPKEMVMDEDQKQINNSLKRYFKVRRQEDVELFHLNENAFPHQVVPDSYLLNKSVIEMAEAQKERIFGRPLRELIRNPIMVQYEGHTSADYDEFEEFLSKILVYDPKKRWTIDDALNSRFLNH